MAQRQAKINLIRYADDFVVTGATQEVLTNEIKPMIEAFLAERGLELSQEKTHITHIEDGFDFLGCNVRRREGKLLITPAKKKVLAFKDKLKSVVKVNPTTTAGALIVQLNPLIRGWGNYYRPWVSSAVFGKVDSEMFVALWRWVQKRHPTQNKEWMQRNYFPHVNNRRWIFTGKVASRKGKLHTIHLVKLGSIAIQRHVKIRADANPYDPTWEHYFEGRLYARMRGTLTDRIDLQMLWSRQTGLCPECHQQLLPEQAWERHHVQWRVLGGSDKLDNLRLLHANCHRKLHAAQPKPKAKVCDSTGVLPDRASGLCEGLSRVRC
jgi:RNA-directed DNA polymerase